MTDSTNTTDKMTPDIYNGLFRKISGHPECPAAVKKYVEDLDKRYLRIFIDNFERDGRKFYNSRALTPNDRWMLGGIWETLELSEAELEVLELKPHPTPEELTQYIQEVQKEAYVKMFYKDKVQWVEFADGRQQSLEEADGDREWMIDTGYYLPDERRYVVEYPAKRWELDDKGDPIPNRRAPDTEPIRIIGLWGPYHKGNDLEISIFSMVEWIRKNKYEFQDVANRLEDILNSYTPRYRKIHGNLTQQKVYDLLTELEVYKMSQMLGYLETEMKLDRIYREDIYQIIEIWQQKSKH